MGWLTGRLAGVTAGEAAEAGVVAGAAMAAAGSSGRGLSKAREIAARSIVREASDPPT
jgi:hypothetical protein